LQKKAQKSKKTLGKQTGEFGSCHKGGKSMLCAAEKSDLKKKDCSGVKGCGNLGGGEWDTQAPHRNSVWMGNKALKKERKTRGDPGLAPMKRAKRPLIFHEKIFT